MMQWVKDIYLKYTGGKKSLFVTDTFSAHCTDEIVSLLLKHHSNIALVPGGCTVATLRYFTKQAFQARVQAGISDLLPFPACYYV